MVWNLFYYIRVLKAFTVCFSRLASGTSFCYRAIPEATSRSFQHLTDYFSFYFILCHFISYCAILFHTVPFYFIGLEFILSHLSASISWNQISQSASAIELFRKLLVKTSRIWQIHFSHYFILFYFILLVWNSFCHTYKCWESSLSVFPVDIWS